MKIIVPVKQVPETSNVKMDPEKGTIVRSGVESIINPMDLYAVETAVQLKEKYGGEVIALSMGPQSAVASIKEAVSMGCDDGILLSDRKFAGSDTWVTSYVISRAVKKIKDFDLVICGERATDGETAQVGPGIASFLDLPVATFTSEIVSVSENDIGIKRLVEDGYELLDMKLPAALTVSKEICAPRLPNFKGKMKARKMDVKVWNAEDIEAKDEFLGLKGSPTRVVKIDSPKVAREGQKFEVKSEEDVDKVVGNILNYLSSKAII
ncbi:electron transfer flavoprotein subunit beta/FixA family protein [Clostridium sp. MT-14]|jgi:electron transfer flavoprotein beta subunit|uniref:Electron transfer flavoprotein small subunit n=1 Tax=Clostridium aromativorans TaxID=2836848 RepID=A0ABS8N631_9CLOT|nr:MULTISPECIES: electron transfer flavoprotein subunit beta/FixA family protein [Clostridium]KAA8680543.1 electron transfer flavoprotein subunit beta/FixA family protein [Clostridium sp. HV4-5-A1G]MCC9295269.1 electron transfer flavoprotein subunit beta/FixA family protein [Clostridium aromativorans]CAB1261856.1 Electron transfer flavoprotein subunit beta [Clostridiaceae bacterium BL-3]